MGEGEEGNAVDLLMLLLGTSGGQDLEKEAHVLE